MTERIALPTQTMEFPVEKQRQLEAAAKARQAQHQPILRPNQRSAVGIAMPNEPTTRQEAAQASYPFAAPNPNPNVGIPQTPQAPAPIADGRVAARHAADARHAAINAGHSSLNMKPEDINKNDHPQPFTAPPVAHQQFKQATPADFAPKFTPEELQPEVPPGRVVPNPIQGFSTPIADSESSSLALPSRFAYYNFKDLYAKPFKAYQLAKLSRAHEEQSMQPMVEAVSSVLSSSTGPVLAHQLTLQDFYFVLYWLKLHSYLKGSYLHTTMCLDPGHLKQVSDGLKTKESLKLQELVTKSTLTVKELEDIPDPEEFNFGPDSSFYLYPATMADTLSFLEHPKARDPEFQYMAQRASYVRVKGHDEITFDQRVQCVEEFDPDQIGLIERFEKLMDSYGVNEKITVRCKECGASRVTKMTLDAHSFLSA